jgi:hypothetical protein
VVSAGGALELRAAPDELLDAPLEASVRGAGGGELLWRARAQDDDGRVWRASAARPEELTAAWAPAKATTGEVAALRSLRPLAVELRAEASDGRATARTVRRRLLADGVKVRRWKDGVAGTLLLPGRDGPCAAVAVTEAVVPDALLPAAALLASRGVLVFAAASEQDGELALRLLASIPAAGRAERPPRLIPPLPLPPGLPTRAAADAAAWDALLAELGAGPRG